ncbi:CGNR zinc finger domain-containing protein [Brevibacterium sediminis]|uniref:Zinc finger CGNR domain-containing protein n=1 Tax=Brevibacterium sediminis TaxID=1857024 RepID=A0A5C4WXA2_9MICO|nr:CGNR zinc finger domain-containing protein [Brevibacterium sediminis]TNM52930.1 hypothetical protein FHQ09_16730 [Brevibacterium sediminis]
MPEIVPPAAAPGELEFVRAFVNTRDIDLGTDRLADPAGWSEWAHEQGIERSAGGGRLGDNGAADDASEAELRRARELREILRDGLLANHSKAGTPDAVIEALTEAARRTTQIVITDRGAELVAAGTGIDAAIGRVVSAATAALGNGTWARLKACEYDSCQWAFFDHSRSRTGRWCSMELCGNRAKQARWRAKQANQ